MTLNEQSCAFTAMLVVLQTSGVSVKGEGVFRVINNITLTDVEMSRSTLPVDVFFKNFRFLKKTVVVKNDDYNAAYKALSKILTLDKVKNTIRAQEYYERPTVWRRRIMYERCKRIYDSEMARKISLVVRTNRVDPWPR
ncbi:unnamed protein product [Trichobilharzia szidati]|nr:unnamed protein product [Trichobilharzia szidati]